MINYLEKYPSKGMTRLLLVIGLLIFIPVYYWLYQQVLTLNVNSNNLYLKALISFNMNDYKDLFSVLQQNNLLSTFRNIYLINLISITGFLVAFMSITIIIARSIKPASRLYKIGYIFVFIVFIQVIMDILFGLTFILMSYYPSIISNILVFINASNYYIRVFLLYCIILWIIYSAINSIITKFLKKKS